MPLIVKAILDDLSLRLLPTALLCTRCKVPSAFLGPLREMLAAVGLSEARQARIAMITAYNGTVSARQEMEAAPLRQIGENLIKEGVASESNSTSRWAADAFTSGKQSLAHGISISGNKMAAS